VATIRVAGIPGDPCGAVLWTVNFQIKKKNNNNNNNNNNFTRVTEKGCEREFEFPPTFRYRF